METTTLLMKTGCAVVLLACLLSFPAVAAETTASVEQLEAALKKSNEELATAQAKVAQLEAQLKASKVQANDLE